MSGPKAGPNFTGLLPGQFCGTFIPDLVPKQAHNRPRTRSGVGGSWGLGGLIGAQSQAICFDMFLLRAPSQVIKGTESGPNQTEAPNTPLIISPKLPPPTKFGW